MPFFDIADMIFRNRVRHTSVHVPGSGGRVSSMSAGSQSSSSPSRTEPPGGITELQSQVARLHMQVQTLARLLIAKGVMEEAELDEWMTYVDSLDGVADGRLKMTKAPRICESCKRTNSPNAVSCQWCGAEMPVVFLDPGKEGAGRNSPQ